MIKKPLAGIRVIDMSQFLPGPFAAQMLADMGADVLKIEPPGGEPMRTLNPVTNQRGPSPFHNVINAGKRVIQVDLKAGAGIQAFKTLITHADILIESYRPGVMARLGLDYNSLRDINPGLIHCALTGYGQSGPEALRSGHDINYMASSGSLSVTGSPSKPQPAFPPVADCAGAMQAVIAVQGALLGRGSDGEGCYLDVAMADTMLSWQTFGLLQQSLADETGGAAPARTQDLLNGGAACYQVYETADKRFVSLGAIEKTFWQNFCEAVDQNSWIERQSDALPQTKLISEVTALFLVHSRDYWDQKLGNVDCCYHPVLSYGELAEWPQFQHRDLFETESDKGQVTGVRFPVWQDGAPPPERAPMRDIGLAEALEAWA